MKNHFYCIDSELITKEAILYQLNIYSISDSQHINLKLVPDYFGLILIVTELIVNHCCIPQFQHIELNIFIIIKNTIIVIIYIGILNYSASMAVLMFQVYQVEGIFHEFIHVPSDLYTPRYFSSSLMIDHLNLQLLNACMTMYDHVK